MRHDEHETLNAPLEAAPAIEIDNLTVTYGEKRALDGLRLVVPRGSVFGLLGVNGAGKTTTIKTLLGFRAPASGSARVLGFDVVTQHLEVCARVGFVSEDSALYDYLTIRQLCAFCRDTSRRWNQAVVDHYLAAFGLSVNAKIGRLSRGMRMQVALCVALGSEPELLLLDEPTGPLDPVARQTFLSAIVEEVAAQGKTVFLSSHSIADIEAVADRVGIMRDGKMLVSDEVDALRQTHKIARVIYEETPSVAEVEAVRHLPGVTHVEAEGRSLRLRVRGDAVTQSALDAALRQRPVAVIDVEIVDLTLEKIALEYLREPEEETNDR